MKVKGVNLRSQRLALDLGARIVEKIVAFDDELKVKKKRTKKRTSLEKRKLDL